MKYLLTSMLSVTVASFLVSPCKADEWGCEVLLCAASSNPSWHGIPACHPPMEKLISAMKRPGFSWPTCPEGGAGKPGYEKYAECPAGWTPTTGADVRDHGFSREHSQCARKVTTCKGERSPSGFSSRSRNETTVDGITRVYSRNNACVFMEFKLRPRRSDPYYFDIKDGATDRSDRFWFNLQK